MLIILFYAANLNFWALIIDGSNLAYLTEDKLCALTVLLHLNLLMRTVCPQGSLLGPLLYLCYCNDMEMSVDSKLILYADDSIILLAAR